MSRVLVPDGAPEWAKNSSSLWNRAEQFEDEWGASRFKNVTIGKSEDWCSEAHFIGQENKISYLVQNNDFTSTLFIKDIVTNKSTEIQKLGQGDRKPVFSPDGKSYVYTEISIFKDDSPRRIAGQGVQLKFKLYHQKLDESLKPLGKPELLTPESFIVSVPTNSYQADYIVDTEIFLII